MGQTRSRLAWFARHKFLSILVVVVVAMALSDGEDSAEVSGAPSAARAVAPSPAETLSDAGSEGADRQARNGKSSSQESSTKKTQPGARSDTKPRAKPEPRTFLVTRVVDGDTLELANGASVRLVGIDTPERGECGYETAATALARLVLGQRVRLTVSDEDRDRYGRLLRYVDRGNIDVGLRQIESGWAVARYDSRDGYGYHPRENVYIATDRAVPDSRCPRPAPRPAVPARDCAPGYSPCVPPYPPDLDCADVNGPVRVTGSDPHGLDADRDGIACE
jgi:endonuclease YncB( thermonuclease family)